MGSLIYKMDIFIWLLTLYYNTGEIYILLRAIQFLRLFYSTDMLATLQKGVSV